MRVIIRIEIHSTNNYSDCAHGRRNKKGYRTVKGKVLNDDKTDYSNISPRNVTDS